MSGAERGAMVLEVTDLRAGYGPVGVLRDVSVSLAQGEVVAVVGANGAGKTTLVKAICGLLPATAGRIVLGGVDITRLPAHRRARRGIATVLEGRHLFGELTVHHTLRLAAAYGRKEQRPAGSVAFTLEDVHRLFPALVEHEQAAVGVLSGGQQQMVAIAKALLLQPTVLVLDEPSTGLAPRLVEEILLVLEQLKSQGMSILLIEQSVGVAADVSERAYVMELGRVVHEGDWPTLLKDDAVARAYLGQ